MKPPVPEVLDVSTVDYVKHVFQKADKDGGGDIDEDEFVAAFTGRLQTDEGSDAECMRKLFYRIDANSDGRLDWDEFSLYMLLENQGSAAIREAKKTCVLGKAKLMTSPQAHKKIVQCCSIIPPSGGNSSRFVTGGRDGIVKLWNCKDLSLNRTIDTGSSSWVTACQYMPTHRCLAVATFSRSLTMYDITSPFCTICGSVPKMDYTPMTMDIWPDRSSSKECEMVIIGDAGGMIHLHRIQPNTRQDSLQELSEVTGKKGGRPKAVDKFREELVWSQIVHAKWVSKVQYLAELESAVSCGLDGLLWLMDVERRTPFVKLDGHTKGVYSCDWSAQHRIIVSGGADKTVCLFNPFSGKKQATLEGHRSGVSDVMVNDRDHQIISVEGLGKEKLIKVWDIRNFRCLQTLCDKTTYRPDDVIGAVMFDAERSQMMSCNTSLMRWPLEVLEGSGVHGHASPVIQVLFNKLFEDILSGDRSGTVCTWDYKTGRLRFRFVRAHGEEVMTTMALDALQRRLLTGSDKGGMKVWNFSSGACLKEMISLCSKDITGILCTQGSLTKYIISVGWDRKLTFFEDTRLKKVTSARQVPVGRMAHEEDILACALMLDSPNMVTAAADGSLKVWNVESGSLRKTLVVRADHVPNHKQAIEALAFMHGKLKHVLVAVGADQMARFWDVKHCALQHQMFTGHYYDESVVAVAVSEDNLYMMTGDSQGIVRTWDLNEILHPLMQGCHDGDLEEDAALPVAQWRAHKGAVGSFTVIAHRHDLMVSCGADFNVCLWTVQGAHIGIFGQNHWTISEPSTWRSEEPLQLSKDDERMLFASRAPSNRGFFQPRATALESMVAGNAAAASAAAASVLANDDQGLPGLEAWKSVQAFLGDPAEIAENHQEDIMSESSDDPEDHDIPASLLLENVAPRSRCSSMRTASRPCSRQMTRPQSAMPVDGIQHTSESGDVETAESQLIGSSRAQTARAGALSAQTKWQRRMGYKAPKPQTDEVVLNSQPARGLGRFRF